MSFTATFKNLGHYFAVGAKYLSLGIGDLVKFANKAQPLEPEIDALIGVLAGPGAVAISDLAFHSLGSLAAALEPVGNDVASLTAHQSKLSDAGITLELQTLMDIKSAATNIKTLLAAIKVAPPAH